MRRGKAARRSSKVARRPGADGGALLRLRRLSGPSGLPQVLWVPEAGRRRRSSDTVFQLASVPTVGDDHRRAPGRRGSGKWGPVITHDPHFACTPRTSRGGHSARRFAHAAVSPPWAICSKTSVQPEEVLASLATSRRRTMFARIRYTNFGFTGGGRGGQGRVNPGKMSLPKSLRRWHEATSFAPRHLLAAEPRPRTSWRGKYVAQYKRAPSPVARRWVSRPCSILPVYAAAPGGARAAIHDGAAALAETHRPQIISHRPENPATTARF